MFVWMRCALMSVAVSLTSCGGGGGGSTGPTSLDVIPVVSPPPTIAVIPDIVVPPPPLTSSDTVVPLDAARPAVPPLPAIDVTTPVPAQPVAAPTPPQGIIFSPAAPSGGSVSPDAGPVASQSPTVLVRLNSAVPAATRALVTAISSAQGLVSPGGELPAFSTGAGALVLAVNANNEIILASVGEIPADGLSAASTALALARLSLGDLSGKVAGSELSTVIKGTTAYPFLVTLVAAELEKQSPPASSPQVLQAVQDTVLQSLISLTYKLEPRTSVLKGLVRDRVESPYPYLLKGPPVGSGLGKMAVSIDVLGTIANSMPIAWGAWTETLNGNLLVHPGEKTGDFILPEGGFLSQFAFGGSKTRIPNDNGRDHLNLVIAQTSLSRAQNFFSITRNVLSLVLSGAPCVDELTQELMKAPELAALYLEPSMDTVLGYFSKFKKGDIQLAVVKGCALSGEGVAKTASSVGAFLAKLSPLKIYDAFSLGAQVRLAYEFWNAEPVRFGLCQNRFGIVDCATSIEMKPLSITYAPGLIINPATDDKVKVIGLSAKGADTLLRIDRLSWTSSNKDVVDVNFGLLVTKTPGLATLEALDKATGAKGSYSIRVVNPVLAPGILRLDATGATGALELIDPVTQERVRVPPDTSWSSDNSGVVKLFPPDSIGGIVRIVFPQAAGVSTITVKSVSGGFTTSSQVVVGKEKSSTIVEVTPSPSKIDGNVTLTGRVTRAKDISLPSMTGTFTFREQSGATLCTAAIAQDSGRCTVSFAAAGTVLIQASYSGDANHAGSTSSTFQHRVDVAEMTNVVVDPKGNWPILKSLGQYDQLRSASRIDLAAQQIAAGSRLALSVTGRYVSFNNNTPPSFMGATGLFYGDASIPSGLPNLRTPCCGNAYTYQAGDEPNDFALPVGSEIMVTVPTGARWLFFGTPSAYFSSNEQGNPPLTVHIRKLP